MVSYRREMMGRSRRTKNDEQCHCFSVFDGKGLVFSVDIAKRHCIVVCRFVLLGQERELHLVAFDCI